MPSSTDIAQLFASQQGQFSQQNYYAQTIGVQQYGMGLGSTQFFGPPSMQRAPGPATPPGVAPPPPVFSYNPVGFAGPGYGAGNAFAGHVMSGIGGAAAAGGIGLGLASMLAPSSMMGKIGSFFDPVSAFLKHGPAMPLINAGGTGTLMGGLAAAAPALAFGAVAAHGVGSFVHGAQQQQQIGNQLGQFGFLNPASRTGMGFTRQDATEIGSTIRQLGHMPELLTSVEELTRMLPKMRQMGVMNGARDAAEFSRRFKETINTVRDMSKMLGTTLEEASAMFSHNRMVGMGSTRDQLSNTLAIQYTSGATGMSLQQVMGLQSAGAATARQFGARSRIGAQGITNLAQKIQAGLENNTIDEGLLTDITGQEGDEAKATASQMLLQANLGLTQSPAGQALLAGLMKRGTDGRFELDQDLIGQVNRGERSIDFIKGRAANLGNAAKMAFKGPQGKNLAMQAAGSLDMGSIIGGLVQQHGREGAELLIDKYFGGQVSQPMVELLMKQGQGGGLGMGLEEFAGMRGKEMELQSRTDPRQMWERIKRKLHSGTFGHVEEVGAKANQAIAKAYDDFIDDLVGRRVVSLSKSGAEAFQRAMSGGDASELRSLFGAKAGMGGGAFDIGGGFLSGGSETSASILSFFGDGKTSGRNAQLQRSHLSGQSGLHGGSLDKWMALASQNAVGESGMAARDAYDRVVSSRVNSFGRSKWEGAAGDVKFNVASEAVGSAIFQGLSRAGIDIEGSGGFQIDAAIRNAGGIEKVLERLDATAGAGDAAALLRAGLEHKKLALKTGAIGQMEALSWTSAAVVGSDKGEKLQVMPTAASNELLSSLRDVTKADKVMREAESALTDAGLGGEEAAIVRSNGVAREVLNAIKNGGVDANRILNMGDEAAAAELRKMFPGVTPKDVADIRKVWSSLQTVGKEGWDAVGKYAVTRKAADAVAIQKKVGDMAAGLSAASGRGDAIGTAAKALSGAMRAFSTANSGEAWEAGVKDMQKHAGALARAYYAEKDPAKRQKLREEMGAAGALLDQLGGAYGKESLTFAEASKIAGGDEALKKMGLDFSSGSISGAELARFQNNVAGGVFGGLVRSGSGSGGVTDADQSAALKAIATNSKLQTDVLILIAKKWKVDEKEIEAKVAAANATQPNDTAGGAAPR